MNVYKDLCCVSLLSRRFHRVSSENFLWNLPISSDFNHFLPLLPLLSSSQSSKSLYKSRFESVEESLKRSRARIQQLQASFIAQPQQQHQAFVAQHQAYRQQHQAIVAQHQQQHQAYQQQHQAFVAQHQAFVARHQQQHQAFVAQHQRRHQAFVARLDLPNQPRLPFRVPSIAASPAPAPAFLPQPIPPVNQQQLMQGLNAGAHSGFVNKPRDGDQHNLALSIQRDGVTLSINGEQHNLKTANGELISIEYHPMKRKKLTINIL